MIPKRDTGNIPTALETHNIHQQSTQVIKHKPNIAVDLLNALLRAGAYAPARQLSTNLYYIYHC